MISLTIALLEKFILPLGALGVFSAEVIEEIVVPIPSAAILLGSGFIFLKGPFTLDLLVTLFFVIVIPATLGLTLGSLVMYGLMYKGGKPFLERYGKWVGVYWDDIDSIRKKFDSGTFDEWTLVLARVFPVIPSVLIAVFCGITRMPVKKYIILTIIGASIKSILLALVGWQVGALYLRYAGIIGRVENVVFVGICVSIIGFILYRKIKPKMI